MTKAETKKKISEQVKEIRKKLWSCLMIYRYWRFYVKIKTRHWNLE